MEAACEPSENFSTLGFAIIEVFIVLGVSTLVFKLGRYDDSDATIAQRALLRSEMFVKLSKWFDRLKAQRDDARAVLEEGGYVEDEHRHAHDRLDGVTHAHDHDHARGDHDFDHRHDHT